VNFFDNPQTNQRFITMPKGGARIGAGRPAGRRDNKTIAKELAIQQVRAEMMKGLTLEDVQKLPAKTILAMAVASRLIALDFDTAAAIAKDLLPYQEARKAPETPTPPGLPPELRRDGSGIGDPDPTPDEQGPENPVP
jgi:hypothetical protein